MARPQTERMGSPEEGGKGFLVRWTGCSVGQSSKDNYKRHSSMGGKDVNGTIAETRSRARIRMLMSWSMTLAGIML